MSNTVYLIELESTMGTKEIEDGIVDLFNARNEKHGLSLVYEQTYGEMRQLLKDNEPTKGSGYPMFKDGVQYWLLPFREHELMGMFTEVTVLTKAELRSYGWDENQEEV